MLYVEKLALQLFKICENIYQIFIKKMKNTKKIEPKHGNVTYSSVSSFNENYHYPNYH